MEGEWNLQVGRQKVSHTLNRSYGLVTVAVFLRRSAAAAVNIYSRVAAATAFSVVGWSLDHGLSAPPNNIPLNIHGQMFGRIFQEKLGKRLHFYFLDWDVIWLTQILLLRCLPESALAATNPAELAWHGGTLKSKC